MEQENRNVILSTMACVVRELIDTSSSSSESDEEMEIVERHLRKQNKVPRIENYVEIVIAQLTDQQFKAHFRMSCATFDYILCIIGPKLERQIIGTPMICPRKQFLLALWRLATPDSLRSICERFNVGRSSALYITRRVTNALIELAPFVIKWPTGEQIDQTWFGFETISGFPKIIGAIDGTHINIPAPKHNPESYINRKGHHSIQLQAVCDHNAQFIHCYAGHVGSVHDQRVLRLSEVQSYLGDALKFPEDCHLVGDSAYKLHDNLLVPYRDNGHLTERERNYNFCHASARIAIERAFGLLKGRFRSLLTILAMNRVSLIPKHIIACCVLHNVCLMRGDEFEIEINEDEMINEANIEHYRDAANVGSIKRNMICRRLRMRNV